MIGIIDYGMGNIHSVQKALQSFGKQTSVINQPKYVAECSALVLPGVGAFDDAMQELKKQGLLPAINAHIRAKRIFLGICLGMQILFEESQEAQAEKGLGIIKGKVLRFKEEKGRKVPQMGWNQLKLKTQNSKLKSECPLLKNIPDGSYVYFCHSYYPAPADKKVIAATTDYGADFASVLWQDNIYGVQFHPEKSQGVGLKILENFVQQA